jgi:hypothetical protein
MGSSKTRGLELSGAHKAAEALALQTLALQSGLPGVTAAAAGMGKQSLQVAGVLGPDFPYGPQGAQFCGSAAHSEE